MKLLAFAGSNSSHSINSRLVRFTLTFISGAEITLLDLNDYEAPLFSVDREMATGYPEQIYAFRQQIEQCDAIILSLAEHNRSYTTAFKNLFDWSSRIDINIFRNKPMLLLSTSPGRMGGANVMNAASAFFPKCGAEIIATFSLPSFYQNFNGADGILDAELKTEFEAKVRSFIHRIS